MSHHHHNHSHQRKEDTGRSESEYQNEEKGGEYSSDALWKCSICGKKEKTVHCVHCGHLVCGECRGNHVRDVMRELKGQKDILEVEYPKSVRERMALINKIKKDLDEKKKKADKLSESAFKDIRRAVDEREAAVKKQIAAGNDNKKRELDSEYAIYEGHLKENKEALDKVSNNSCATIHFPVRTITDEQVASLCQTRKLYADIIDKLHKPEEREEPTRTALKVKFDTTVENAKKEISQYGEVSTDEKEKKKISKEKEKNKDDQNEDQHRTDSPAPATQQREKSTNPNMEQSRN